MALGMHQTYENKRQEDIILVVHADHASLYKLHQIKENHINWKRNKASTPKAKIQTRSCVNRLSQRVKKRRIWIFDEHACKKLEHKSRDTLTNICKILDSNSGVIECPSHRNNAALIDIDTRAFTNAKRVFKKIANDVQKLVSPSNQKQTWSSIYFLISKL